MKKNENVAHAKKRSGRRVWLALMVVPVVMAGWVVYASYVITNGVPGGEQDGWSAEVLDEIHEGIVTGSPINMANACGLGASSCFKCHNGKRAEEPGPQKWHSEHESVNHSCAGCHKGNQRLMVKSMAHRDLVGDPRMKPETTCMSCHKDEDQKTLLDNYMGLE
ncbi:MAG: hypothetical protein ACQETD_02870 [Pseudomonadota bacterium]